MAKQIIKIVPESEQKGKNYAENQAEWLKREKLKLGDRVKVKALMYNIVLSIKKITSSAIVLSDGTRYGYNCLVRV